MAVPLAVALPLAVVLSACWLATVEFPPLKFHCPSEEYAYSGQCCRKCPAGTYVDEHCINPHSLGSCIECNEGEDYTEHENGLEQCLPCDKCKYGYEMVRPCTTTSNTECQCRDGYYCPPGFEECIMCKTKCPEGQVIVKPCSATSDTVCGTPPEGNKDSEITIPLIICAAVVLPLLSVLGVFLLYKGRNFLSKSDKENDAKVSLIPVNDILKLEVPISGVQVSRNDILSPNPEMSDLISGGPDEESTSGNVSSAPSLQLSDNSDVPNGQSNVQESQKPVMIVKNASSKELSDNYFKVTDMVRPHDWNTLMRKCDLSDIDIEKSVRDFPFDTREQHYQMLKTLQDKLGIEASLYKLLNGLWEMNLKRIHENITNELRDQDLIAKED